jgi:hypothetical protein
LISRADILLKLAEIGRFGLKMMQPYRGAAALNSLPIVEMARSQLSLG